MSALADRLKTVLDSGLVDHAEGWSLKAGLSSRYLSTYFVRASRSGKASITTTSLRRLAEAAGVSVDWLASGRGPMRLASTLSDPAVTTFSSRIVRQVESWASSVRADPKVATLPEKQALAILQLEWSEDKGHIPPPREVAAPAAPKPDLVTILDAVANDPRAQAIDQLRQEYAGNTNALAWLEENKAAFAGEVDWLKRLRAGLKAHLGGREASPREPVDDEARRDAERTKRITTRSQKSKP